MFASLRSSVSRLLQRAPDDGGSAASRPPDRPPVPAQTAAAAAAADRVVPLGNLGPNRNFTGGAAPPVPAAAAPNDAMQVQFMIDVNGTPVMVIRNYQAPAAARRSALLDAALVPSFKFRMPSHARHGSTDRTSCTVCLSEFAENDDVKLLPCLHTFHAECIGEWFQEHSTCPVCQQDIGKLIRQGNTIAGS